MKVKNTGIFLITLTMVLLGSNAYAASSEPIKISKANSTVKIMPAACMGCYGAAIQSPDLNKKIAK